MIMVVKRKYAMHFILYANISKGAYWVTVTIVKSFVLTGLRSACYTTARVDVMTRRRLNMAIGSPEGRNPLFPLRALLEFEPSYGVFVGRCLETGSVVTADDMDTIREMLKELLEDEIEFAVEHENFTNLFSNPAPPDVWLRWHREAANLGKAGKQLEVIDLKVDAKEFRLDEQEVSSVRIVSRAAA